MAAYVALPRGRTPMRSVARLLAVCLLAIAFLCARPRLTAAATARRARRHRQPIIAPYAPYGVTNLFSQADIWSPDLRYIASARIGEGSIVIVTVRDAHSHQALAHLDDVQGFIWAPNRQHRLVAAACGEYGKAFLGTWEGGHSWQSLHAVRRPEYECFQLHGITADGRYIVYGYDPNINTPDGPRDALLRRRLWLRLPAH